MTEKTVLIVDDDELFCEVMGRAMSRRGYKVLSALNSESALAQSTEADYAIIDLRIGEESGLALVQALAQQQPDIKMLMLTGYASIATAVNAIKLGAVQYFTKPAEPDDIIAALEGEQEAVDTDVPETTMTVNRVEWEHLQRVLDQHEGNISAAARALGMHRRTLQRKLKKRPMKQ